MQGTTVRRYAAGKRRVTRICYVGRDPAPVPLIADGGTRTRQLALHTEVKEARAIMHHLDRAIEIA